jgi:regulator of protease activity HflC (stomatin/prohibitin superfamily)
MSDRTGADPAVVHGCRSAEADAAAAAKQAEGEAAATKLRAEANLFAEMKRAEGELQCRNPNMLHHR